MTLKIYKPKKRILVCFIFALMSFTQVFAQPTTQGKEFWLTYGKNNIRLYDQVDLKVRFVASDAAKVTMKFLANNAEKSFLVPAGGVVDYTFTKEERMRIYPDDSFSSGSAVAKKSLYITSSEPVTVYAFNQAYTTTDATNLFPVSNLGETYYHISYMPVDRDGFAVVATEDATTVTSTTINGTETKVLNRGEVYYRSAYDSGDHNKSIDMTGSLLTSNKPVAYFVASSSAYIPLGHYSTDNLFQQLPPINEWGLRFFIPVTKRGVERVRIIASQNGTNLTVTGGYLVNPVPAGSANKTTGLNAGQWVELEINSTQKGSYISSNYPVGVCSYLVGKDYTSQYKIGTKGDPSICWIPPIEQTVKSSTIAVLNPTELATALDEHHAILVTKTSQIDNTRMAIGKANPGKLSGGTWTNHSSGYSYYSLELRDRYNSYYFANDSGLYILGYGLGDYETYHYVAGSAVRNINPSFYINDVHYEDINGHTFCGINNFNFRIFTKPDPTPPGTTLRWYVNDIEQTSSPNAYNANTWSRSLTKGTYTVKMFYRNAAGKEWTLSTNFTVKELTATADNIVAPASLCSGGPTTVNLNTLVSAPGIENPVFRWYYTESGAIHLTETTVDINNVNGQTFYVSVEGKNHCEGVASSAGRRAVTIRVSPPATASNLIGPANTSVCSGGTAQLTAVQSGVSNAVYYWYEAASGGTPFYTGQTYTTPALTSQKDYYVSVSGSNTCEGNYRRKVTVSITPAAKENNFTGPTDASVCGGGSVSLTAASNVASPIYCWYNEASGGTPFYKGETYNTPAITKTTTYYVSVSGTNICEGTYRRPVTVTLNSVATISNITGPANISVCSNSTVRLAASSKDVSNPVYHWYNSQNAATSFHTGAEYTTPILSSTAKYYVSVSGSDVCEGGASTRKEVVVTVNQQAPYNAITGPANTSVCKGSSTILTATSTGVSGTPTYSWYDASGRQLQTGIATTYQTPALTTTTTYYVGVAGENYCETNANNRRTVTVTVTDVSQLNPSKTAITLKTGATPPDIATAMGITASTGHTLVWYSSSNTVISKPTISTTTAGLTKYFVSQKNSTGCESPKVQLNVLVTNQAAASYSACYSAPLKLEASNITGISYYWYSTETGGFSLMSNSNIYEVVAIPPQTFWVEPRDGSTIFPRFKIDISIGTDCFVDLSDCAKSGTLIFKQDFGGNSPSDAAMSSNPLPAGSTDLSFGLTVQGYYGLVKNAKNFNNNFFNLGDHTHLGDMSRGYLMVADPKQEHYEKTLYQTKVKVPCTGVNMSFSAWLIDLDAVAGNPIPTVRFVVLNASNLNDTILQSKSDIAIGPKGGEWRQYELWGNVNAPEVIFKIINKLDNANGNDLGIDDIEVRFCAPPVIITTPSQHEICEGENVTIEGEFIDSNGTFAGSLTKFYLWEFSETGDVNVSWDMKSSGNFSDNSITTSYTISDINSDKTGYYRLRIIDVTGNSQCIISSDPVYFSSKPRAQKSNIIIEKDNTAAGSSIDLCYEQSAALTATSNIQKELIYRWYNEAGQFIQTGKTFITPQLTQTTTYSVSIEAADLCENIPANRQTVTINVHKTEAPTVSKPILTYLQFADAKTIAVDAGLILGSNCTANWYLNNGTTPFAEANAPISTLLPGLNKYYVSQTNNVSGCESSKVAVNVLVVKPEFTEYVSCLDLSVTLKVDAITGVDFYWYSQATGGTALTGSPSNSITVAPESLPKTYYVEPRDGVNTYARVAVPVILSSGCRGIATDCMKDGILIYKEDFGGNDGNDPNFSPVGLPAGYTDLTYRGSAFPGGGTSNYYTLVKRPELAWHEYERTDDHTYPNDTNKGYLMVVDPSSNNLGSILYQTVINNLCSEMVLSFSAWFVDLYPTHTSPSIEMQMVDVSTGAVLITTGIITIAKKKPWEQYGFNFRLPKGVSSVRFKIINREVSQAGNDLGIDDIEIRTCVAKVDVAMQDVTMACPDMPFTLAGNFTDNGTFGNSLLYRWEYSLTGEANNQSAWSVVPNSEGASSNGVVKSVFTIPSFGTINEGYYRLVVSTPESIDSWVCRSVSKNVHVLLQPVSLIWTGEAQGDGQNWNNPQNWYPAFTPMACNVIYIPGNLNNYPVLTTEAVCGDIHFIYGAELGRPDLLKYNRAFIQYNLGLDDMVQTIDKSDKDLLLNSETTTERMLYSASVSAPPMKRERWYMLSTPLHGATTGDMSFGGFPFSFVQKFGPITKDGYEYQTGNWTTFYTSPVEKLSSKATDAYAFYMYGYDGQGDEERNLGCFESGIYGDPLRESNYLPLARMGKKYGLKESNGILELPFFADSTNLYAHRTQVYDEETNTSTFYMLSDGMNYFPDFNKLTGDKMPIKRESNNGNYRFAAETYNTQDSRWEFHNTITLPSTGLVKDEYFMVGNPYMSSIDMVKFLQDNANSVHNCFLLWNGDNFISCSIDLGNGNIIEADESDMLYTAPLQGFFLKYKGGGEDILFNVSNISTVRQSGGYKLRSAQEKKEENILRIKAENSYSISYSVIAYKENASVGFNKADDVQKLFSPYGEVPSIYSLADNTPVDINFVGNKNDIVIPLGIKTYQTGETKLTFSGMDNYTKASKIELIDALEKKTIDMTGKSSYTYSFNSAFKGVTNGRFSLRISTSTTSLKDIDSDNDIKVYGSTKGIYVVSTEPVIKLEAFDLSGRKMYESGDNLNYYLLPANLANSPLIIRVMTKNLVKTVKVNGN